MNVKLAVILVTLCTASAIFSAISIGIGVGHVFGFMTAFAIDTDGDGKVDAIRTRTEDPDGDGFTNRIDRCPDDPGTPPCNYYFPRWTSPECRADDSPDAWWVGCPPGQEPTDGKPYNKG